MITKKQTLGADRTNISQTHNNWVYPIQIDQRTKESLQSRIRTNTNKDSTQSYNYKSQLQRFVLSINLQRQVDNQNQQPAAN